MKRRMKLLGVMAALLALIACLTACANWKSPYELLEKEGYCVSVRFDANGGSFAGSPYEVYVVDVFDPSTAKTGASGKKEIPLVTPDDAVRGDTAFEISRDGYYLAGWYTQRMPRVNAQGEPLDELGQLCSASGKEQGYVYSEKWNFETDRLEVDPNKKYSADENALTLYAAWIPYATFEFYDLNSGALLGTYEKGMSVTVPTWDTSTGKLSMGRFPKLEGKTFEAAYLSVNGEMQQVNGTITGGFDEATGVATANLVKIYTTWTDGEWFHVYTAKQFRDNFKENGNYVICADLDFSKTAWKPEISQKAFGGTILGNGYRFINVSATQTSAPSNLGGLFGELTESAVIKDLTFENVTYVLNAVARTPGSGFGILAGKANDAATLENVKVSGVMEIGESCVLHATDYNLGLLFGIGSSHGIELSGLSCKSTAYTVSVDPTTGVVTITK